MSPVNPNVRQPPPPPRPAAPLTPAEVQAKLPKKTKGFRQSLIDQAPQDAVKQGAWEYDSFNYADDADEMLGSICTHLGELGVAKNKGVCVGPGRDGSSDKKIAVDCAFGPKDASIPFSAEWSRKRCVKTTYGYCDDVYAWAQLEKELPLRESSSFAGGRRRCLAQRVWPCSPVQRSTSTRRCYRWTQVTIAAIARRMMRVMASCFLSLRMLRTARQMATSRRIWGAKRLQLSARPSRRT